MFIVVVYVLTKFELCVVKETSISLTNKECFINTQMVSGMQENHNIKDGDTPLIGGNLPE
jgi:hypothetical protein